MANNKEILKDLLLTEALLESGQHDRLLAIVKKMIKEIEVKSDSKVELPTD